CVGLLDQDDAGIKAKKVLATKAFTENQLKTFKCFELKPIYNTDVLNFYKKGIKIEIDIESLFPITVLKRAEELSYLEMRNPGFIEPPQKWIQFHTSFKEYCKGQGIEDDYFYYLNKVKKIKKDDFRKQVDVSINSSELDNFKLLLNDLFIVLGI
ncbi:MAG: hypothetical protein L6407_05270, partial [Candidatus Delongbacteria bacterium]|nr:hypothetical protein [Candidatus Delongbacteria bacterium]